jgi:hypothetical protein
MRLLTANESRTRTTTRTSTIEESKRGGINPLMRPTHPHQFLSQIFTRSAPWGASLQQRGPPFARLLLKFSRASARRGASLKQPGPVCASFFQNLHAPEALCCSWILPLFDLSPTQPLFQSSSSSSSLSIFDRRSLTEGLR